MENKISVGFGRVVITPKETVGLPMEGYSNQISQGVLEDILGTCIAITDEKGQTLLLYTVDRTECNKPPVDELRERLSAAYGIPGDNITVSATHTHSGPVLRCMPDYVDDLEKAAQEAMADRSPATISVGSYDVPDMNFTRHYHMKDGSFAGDNYGDNKVGYKDYTSIADPTMRLIRFHREDKKDVVMVNWQVHPKLASTWDTPEGRATRYLLSPDLIGYARDYVEATETDVLFAYYTGAAANVNPFSKLAEKWDTTPKLASEYGVQFGKHVVTALKDLKPVESGDLGSKKTPLGDRGFELHAYRLGDHIGIATAPAEICHETGTQIREGSPFETTFVLSCANGRDTYIPIDEVWDYQSNNGTIPYEVRICRYPRGTAELLAKDLGKMLTELAQK